MVMVLLSLALIAGIAFFQVVQGLFSAMIMLILSILSALIAFNYYEQLAALIAPYQHQAADGIALVGLFVVVLLSLRFLADRFLGANVVMGPWADRIGGGVLGIFSGLVLVGMMFIGMQMLPYREGILTWTPYDTMLERDQSVYADDFTVGMVESLSAASLGGERTFASAHSNLLLELHGARNTAALKGSVQAAPDCLKVIAAYVVNDEMPEVAGWIDELPRSPVLNDGGIQRVLVVEVDVAASAADSDRQYRLVGTQFQVVTADGVSHFPLGYLTYDQAASTWKFSPPPARDGKHALGELVVQTSANKSDSAGVVWVYKISKEEPQYMSFRRISTDNIRKVDKTAPRPPAFKASSESAQRSSYDE